MNFSLSIEWYFLSRGGFNQFLCFSRFEAHIIQVAVFCCWGDSSSICTLSLRLLIYSGICVVIWVTTGVSVFCCWGDNSGICTVWLRVTDGLFTGRLRSCRSSTVLSWSSCRCASRSTLSHMALGIIAASSWTICHNQTGHGNWSSAICFSSMMNATVSVKTLIQINGKS